MNNEATKGRLLDLVNTYDHRLARHPIVARALTQDRVAAQRCKHAAPSDPAAVTRSIVGDGVYAYRCSDADTDEVTARDGSGSGSGSGSSSGNGNASVVLWRYGGSQAVFWRR